MEWEIIVAVGVVVYSMMMGFLKGIRRADLRSCSQKDVSDELLVC